MSIIVEHEKRRREILEQALDLFLAEGYGRVTFQKIALRCDITRTTLYIYFKNKKEIFNYSIKQFLDEVEGNILKFRRDKSMNSIERLTRVLTEIVDHIEMNRRLILVVLEYLSRLDKKSGNPDDRVRRRTIRLRHILATLVIEGIRKGEIAPVNIRDVDNLLYGLLETAIFRLGVLKRNSVNEMKEAVRLAVRRLEP